MSKLGSKLKNSLKLGGLAVAAALVVSAPAYAATHFIYHGGTINGNSHKSSGVFANHTQHYILQNDSNPNRYVQTGHQNSSGAHVAIKRGWGGAVWGPSGPAGWYGKPKCWNLSSLGAYFQCGRYKA